MALLYVRDAINWFIERGILNEYGYDKILIEANERVEHRLKAGE